MLFVTLLLAPLGFAASAHAQAVVTWDESTPVFAFGGGNLLSNGDSVPVGTTVSFDVHMIGSSTYLSPPSGCNISHDSGDTWNATITETCHVTIDTTMIMLIGSTPGAVLGEFYVGSIMASGGHSPLDVTLESGDFPAGITFSGGSLSGTPSETGSFGFTLRATDGYGHFTTQSFTLTVNGPSATPTITSVSPTNGPAEGGTSVAITGTNLTGATAVTFGGDPAFSFVVNSATLITATTSPHAEGPVDVSVTTPGGSATAPGAFTYDAPVDLLMSIDDVTVLEGDSGIALATFTVSLNQPVPQFRSVTFDVATADGTAIAGVDYQAVSNPGSSMGQSNQFMSFTVFVNGNTIPEPDKTFFVNITNVSGATLVDGQGQGTITNDDAPAGHTVSWSTVGSTAAITATAGGMTLSSGGTVPAGSVVSFRVQPEDGMTYPGDPFGCAVHYVSSDASGDLWQTDPLTADCAVQFRIAYPGMFPGQSQIPDAVFGQLYAGVQFSTQNQYPPFTQGSWSQSGALPAGMSLSTAGLLSGTPQESGTFTFNVALTNVAGHVIEAFNYAITVVSDNADLSALSLSEGALTPGFDSSTTGYGATVPHDVDTIAMTPTAVDPNATISVNGQAVTSGSASAPIPLTVGDTPIAIVVTAQDGTTTKTYTVNVAREAAPAPTITGIAPTSGPTAGGTSVIITGTDFNGATLVMFGVTPAASFTVNSATQITATTPAHAEGAIDVVVFALGGSATAQGGFTYTAPVIPSLSISDVTVSEGDSGETLAAFTVSIDQIVTTVVTFDVATADGAAIAGDDYLANAVSGFGISPGFPSRQFVVKVLGDTLHEPDETFFVNVTNVVGATVAKAQGLGTILNDDAAAPTANDLSVTAPYGGSQTITPNITGSPATSIAVLSAPTHGSTAVNGLSIVYTPTAGYAGPDSFTYTATGPGGTSAPATVTITVSPPIIVYTPANPSSGIVGASYGQSVAGASGGLGPYTYAQASGTLPPGLALSAGGDLQGAPTAAGTFDFTIIATDSSSGSGPFSSAPADVSVTIDPAAPTIISVSPASGLTTGGTSVAITGTGLTGATAVSFGGAAATGFAVDSDTQITAVTPAHAQGAVDVAVTTPGGSGALSGAFTYEEPASNDASLANLVTSAGALSPAFTPGVTGYAVAVANPVVSLTLTPTAAHAGAAISVNGQPAASGSPSPAITLAVGDNTITVVVTAEDASTTRTYVVTVSRAAPVITIDPETLPDAVAGSSYGPVPLTAEGGAAPYVFVVTTGNLPDGLSLAATGELAGAPTEAGTFTFTVTATDDDSFTGTRDYVLAVDPPTIAIGPDALPDGMGGVAYGPANLTADGGAAPYAFAISVGELPNGLTLAASGELSGTPLEAGSFPITVTATDSNSFTASRQFSLSIDMPEIVVTAPPMPEGKVNTPFTAVRLSASGGVGPYAFSVTAGELPQGMILAADGRLSGTPTQAGDFAVTVAATDSLGFAGTTGLSLRINKVNIPVARDLTLEVMAGTSGSIDLTLGATNGPFTRAAIAVHPAAEVGRAAIRKDGAAYMLDFAAANAFEGSASLQYTLSNADGRSAPATVTLNVIARPDPSQDPEVIGLLTAQAEAAKRFARTQTQNFNERLEQLHDEGDRRRNSMTASMSLQRRETDRAAYYAKEEERDRIREAFERVDAHGKESAKPASNASDAPGDHSPLGKFAVWSGGFVNFAEADNGSIDLDSTLVGLSGGADYRFTPKFVAGLGFGYGRDKTDIGQNGTESLGQAWSMAAYGSYKPTPEIFIDGLIGYSLMNFDSRRYISATGDFAQGSRDGQQIFGSLTAGYEHRRDGWLLSPYGRLEVSRSRLDAFTESGGGMWDLTYGDQNIDTLSGILGLRVEYAMPMDWGVLKPRARVEYTHDFEGSSRVSVGYADIGTLPYAVETEPFSKDHLTIGLGLDAQIGDGWTFGFDYRTAYGSGGRQQDHTFAIKIGAQW